MKSLKILFGLLVASVTAKAQFVAGPTVGSALDTSTPVAIVGGSLSNLLASQQKLIPVGVNGVGFAITVYGTNATTTTNAVIRLQGSVDGSTWIDSPDPVVTLSVPQSGTTVYTVYTNILPNAVASQNAGNLRYLRVKSIQNTNVTHTVWVSNMLWSVRY